METRTGRSEAVRFRTRRRFFTTIATGAWLLLCTGAGVIAVFAGPWVAVGCVVVPVVGWGVFVLAVPPAGGRRYYEVTSTGLVVRAAEQSVIPWREIEYVVHRPLAKTFDGGATTTHWEYLELFLRDPEARSTWVAGLGRREVFGRRGRGKDRRLFISGVHRQDALSKLIIGRCRDQVVRHLRAAFVRGREVEYGDFRFDREGVRSPGGFLPWHPEWRIRHHHSGEGAGLVITGPDGQTIGGWTPERTSAEELIRALAEEHERGVERNEAEYGDAGGE